MKKKTILIVLLALIVIGGVVAYYLWNKPKTNAADVKPNYVLPADSLVKAFVTNEEAANAKYVKDSVALEIEGIVDTTYINEGNEAVVVLATSLESPVTCYFIAGEASNTKKGDKIHMKGYCNGYMMLDGVQMSKCAVVK
jgi:uncharacterized protein YxeA